MDCANIRASFAATSRIWSLPRKEIIVTHFDDLTDCDYFGAEYAHLLRAVGWLTNDRPFATGRMESDVFAKLKELMHAPWQPMIASGVHECQLCQFDRPCGHANLFIPNGDVIFVCPELIVHYVASHHYRPPDEFIAAVKNCPLTSTMHYKKLLLESGGRPLVLKTG